MASAQQCSNAARQGSQACEQPQTHDGGIPLKPDAVARADARKNYCKMCETLGPNYFGAFGAKMALVDQSKSSPNLVPRRGWSAFSKQDAQLVTQMAQEYQKNGESQLQKELAADVMELEVPQTKQGFTGGRKSRKVRKSRKSAKSRKSRKVVRKSRKSSRKNAKRS